MGEDNHHRIPKEDPPELSGESCLRRATVLISSLITLSHSCKVFTVKWQSIRNKLDELNSGLLAANNCNSGESSELSGVIHEIMGTTNDCLDLASRCVNLSYSGKLLMQSDIDIMSSKFDRHVKSLSEIVASGIFFAGTAIVVGKPGLGACKDDMRFYVRDLLTRLKIGDREMKRKSLIALNELIIEDEKYVKICIEMEGIISVLVNLLDFPEAKMQEESANFVLMVSKFDAYKQVLIGSGAVSPLIRVLENGNESAKEASAKCLQKLTANSENVWSVSAHGGVTALLKICSKDGNRGDLIGLACGVLKNLIGVEEIKRFMVEEGAITTFIKLARSKDESSQINSIELLQIMAFGDELIRQIVIKDGGIRVLVRVFDPKSSLSSKTREMALKAIDNLCFSSMNTISVLMNYGFLDHLLYFLRHGEISVQELALKAAFRLIGLSEETKKSMGDSGFMPEFIKFLDLKSYEVREMAAEALYRMILVPKNRRKFVQDDRNIVTLLQFLGPEQNHGNYSGNDKRFLLSTLMVITSSSSARRKIVTSGYMKNIEKLAESEVSDAKKIIRKLSKNSFRNIITGIWHS